MRVDCMRCNWIMCARAATHATHPPRGANVPTASDSLVRFRLPLNYGIASEYSLILVFFQLIGEENGTLPLF